MCQIGESFSPWHTQSTAHQLFSHIICSFVPCMVVFFFQSGERTRCWLWGDNWTESGVVVHLLHIYGTLLKSVYFFRYMRCSVQRSGFGPELNFWRVTDESSTKKTACANLCEHFALTMWVPFFFHFWRAPAHNQTQFVVATGGSAPLITFVLATLLCNEHSGCVQFANFIMPKWLESPGSNPRAGKVGDDQE